MSDAGIIRKLGLKGRIILAFSLLSILIFTLATWSIFNRFKSQFEEVISQQQFALVSEIADSIDGALRRAQDDIIIMADNLPRNILSSPEKVQAYLDRREEMQVLFDNGIFLFSRDGRMIAESPFIAGRRGKDYSHREYFKKTVETKMPYISSPYRSSQKHGHPAVNFTAPILGRDGAVLAVLAGSMDLTKQNFLKKISSVKIGKTGYLYMYDTSRTIIIHPDESRIMKQDVPPGANKLFDRAIEGFEGTGETVNSRGLHMLASFKRLKSANWIIGANYPHAEAYEPIFRARRYVMAGNFAGLLAILVVVWFFMRRTMYPLERLTEHVAGMAGKQGSTRFLKIESADEIGELTTAFNGMIAEIDRQNAKLAENAQLYRTVTEFASDMSFWLSEDGRIRYISPNCERLTGYTEQVFREQPGLLDDIIHPDDRDAWAVHVRRERDGFITDPLELRIIIRSGELRWIRHICRPVFDENDIFRGLRGSHTDITDLKQAQLDLQMSEETFRRAFQQGPIWIAINDLYNGRFVDANDVFLQQTGYSRDEVIGRTTRDICLWVDPNDHRRLMDILLRDGVVKNLQTRFLMRSGEVRTMLLSAQTIRLHGQECVITSTFDITERAVAEEQHRLFEEKIRLSEEKFSRAFRSSPDWLTISRIDDGTYVEVNDAYLSMTGYTRDEVIGRTSLELGVWARPSDRTRLIEHLTRDGSVRDFEVLFRMKSGAPRLMLLSAETMEMQDVRYMIAVTRDITDRKNMEIALKDKLDFLQRIIDSTPNPVFFKDIEGVYIGCNKAFEVMSGRSRTEIIGHTVYDMLATQIAAYHMERDRDLYETGGVQAYEMPVRFPDGTLRRMLFNKALFMNSEGRVGGIVGTVMDITELKATEERIRKLSLAVEQSPVSIVVTDPKGGIEYVNPHFTRVTGYTSDEAVGATPRILKAGTMPESVYRDLWETISSGREWKGELQNKKKNGELFWEHVSISPITAPGGRIMNFIGVKEDITVQKQHMREMEAVVTVSTAMRSARSRKQLIPIIIDQILSLLVVDGVALGLRDTMTGKIVMELGGGEWVNWTGVMLSQGEGITGMVISSKQPYVTANIADEPLFVRPDIVKKPLAAACVPLIAQNEIIGVIWTARDHMLNQNEVRILLAIADIAANAIHRISLHEQTEGHLRKLSMLHSIDLAITSSLNLESTLNSVLTHITEGLNIDAADVLLINPATSVLEYAAGRGFSSNLGRHENVSFPESLAGMAAVKQRIITLHSLTDIPVNDPRKQLFQKERFCFYVAVPLVAKGEVKGVLELFSRTSVETDVDLLEFIDALAVQTAIAIDNARLFDELERSNIELVKSYDATIEGWSLALDLRDEETHGHTVRVTEITVKLARAMGLPEDELVDIRRGALLHDIGKMGVPDAVLLKRGPLTEEERVVMSAHPVWAFEMLAHIPYLRRALDIPYCHHEWWNGTGYPRGLRGEDIPLAARIFSVVDVWDALGSNRPYREAWEPDRVMEHIRTNAGIQFDPHVVEAFLRMMQNKE